MSEYLYIVQPVYNQRARRYLMRTSTLWSRWATTIMICNVIPSKTMNTARHSKHCHGDIWDDAHSYRQQESTDRGGARRREEQMFFEVYRQGSG